MADKKLNIKVGTKGTDKAKKKLKGVEGGLKSLGKQAMVAGAAFFGARAIIGGLKEVIRLAGEQEMAEKKLSAQLGHVSNALLNQAKAYQKTTMFGDEMTLGVMASISAFTKNEEHIAAATGATLDFAAAMGFDLKSAGDLIAKTLGSSTNALTRYGVTVEGAVGSSERLESLTSNIAKLFGGQAKAQAETMAGAMAQADNAAGDLGEAIGKRLAPMVTDIAKGMTSFTTALTEFIDISEEERIKQLEKEISDLETTMKLTGAVIDEDTGFFKKLMIMQSGVAGTITATNEAYDEQTIKLEGLREELRLLTEIPVPEMPEIPFPDEEDLEILGDVMLSEKELAWQREQSAAAQLAIQNKINKAKEDQVIADLKNAALSGQGAIAAMKSVVRAETMEAVAGYISGVLKTVPFPFNVVLAAAGGGLVAGLMDKAMGAIPNSFAQGGDFVTSGKQLIMVGDNPSGRERVTISPDDGKNFHGGQTINLNISAPLVDETVVNSIIPAIEKATRLNLA